MEIPKSMRDDGSGKPYLTVTIECTDGLRKKYIERLVFLFNNLVQYYGVAYKETILKYKTILGDDESIVLYNPVLPSQRNEEIDYVYGVLDTYITSGILTSESMVRANELWNKLKQRAGVE